MDKLLERLTNIDDMLGKIIGNLSTPQPEDVGEGWYSIENSHVLCVYADCPKHSEKGTTIEVTPDSFQNDGIPICGECGDDLKYLHTKIKIHDANHKN
jgi:hypothetical protein